MLCVVRRLSCVCDREDVCQSCALASAAARLQLYGVSTAEHAADVGLGCGCGADAVEGEQGGSVAFGFGWTVWTKSQELNRNGKISGQSSVSRQIYIFFLR